MMDGADGYLRVDVKVDENSYESSLNDLEQKGGEKAGKMQGIFAGVGAAIGTAITNVAIRAVDALVDGAQKIATTGIEFNKQMETYQMGFTTMLGDEEQAAAVMAQIREDAARTPFDVSSLTQANQLLVSAGVDAGDARDTIIALGDAVAATGGGSAELSRMAQNLQQVKNVGKATSMDIKQFAMAGINIYGVLADYTGKSTQEVQNMEISYDLLTAALQHASEEGGMFYGSMDAQSQTLAGRLSTLQDNFSAFAGEIMEGVSPVIGDLIDTISENVFQNDELKDSLIRIVGAVAELIPPLVDLAMTVLPPLIDLIAEIMPLITEIFELLLPALQLAIEGIGWVIENLIGPAIDWLCDKIEAAKEPFQKFIDFIRDFFVGGWKDAWQAVKDFFGNIWEGITNFFKDRINQNIDTMNWFIRGLNKVQIPDWVPGVGGKGINIKEIPRLKVGMDYVPSDDFPALLHKGEAVLTAADANVWRAQQSGFSAAQDAAQMAQIASALQTLSLGVAKLADLKLEVSVDYGRGDLGALARILNPYITAETSRTGGSYVVRGGR